MPNFHRNRLSGVRPSWHAANILTKFDSFDRKMPGFTLRGEESISTSLGGFLTLLMFFIITVFSMHKVIKLTNKLSPIVNKITLPDAIDD